jgi:hypothetical protein
MPDKLPENFFIPDSDYDTVLGDDEQRNIEMEAAARAAIEAPKPHFLLDQLDEILKKTNVPQDMMESVHNAITKELGIVSSEATP